MMAPSKPQTTAQLPNTTGVTRQTAANAQTRVPARWRVPLRFAWLAITAFTVTVFCLNLPTYYDYLQKICLSVDCHSQQLNAAQALALRALGMSLQGYAGLTILLNFLFAAVFFLTGVLLFIRKSDDWLALFSALTLVTFGLGTFVSVADILPPEDTLMIAAARTSAYVGNISIFLFFIIFPNGRFVPRWSVVPWVLFGLIYFFQTFFTNTALDPNRLAPNLTDAAFLGVIAFSIGAQFYRYRYVSLAVERAQTKWVVFGSIFSLIVFIALSTAAGLDPILNGNILLFLIGNLLYYIVIALIPISIGIAILRSHLWDIDILIRRTATYTLLSAALLVIFFGTVLILQQLFATLTGARQNELVTVLSTLAIAALFVPLRSRFQTAIDRRYNRSRYDAQQVLNEFAETVRDETDLEQLTARLMEVVNQTVQPRTVSVWLKRGEDGK